MNMHSVLNKKLQSQQMLRSGLSSSSLSEIFHENTKLSMTTARAYSAHIQRYLSSTKMTAANAAKVFSMDRQISLAGNKPTGDARPRRSMREFSGDELKLHELSTLLHNTYGITDAHEYWRASPSAGALYPLEIYIMARNIEHMSSGIYHYNPLGQSLDVIYQGDLKEVEDTLFASNVDMESVACIVVITAVFQRSTIKYGDRGYRMLMLEAGSLLMALSLEASKMNLGSCAIGGFYDDRLAEWLKADGIEEAPIIPVVIGRLLA